MITLKEAREICRGYDFASLTSHPGYNSKFSKAMGVYNAGYSLAPGKESGHEVCTARGLCFGPCVSHTGRAEYDPGGIKRARIGRTRLLFRDPENFENVARAEAAMTDRKAKRLQIPVAFRPNTFSDLDWPLLAPWLFEEYPDWHFYGYTKVRGYVERFLSGDLPPNYHLTFSWSEACTVRQAIDYVNRGINVAVPFFDRDTLRGTIPDTWYGVEVIDGDRDDLRFRDPQGVIVGLRTKLPKKRFKAVRTIKRSEGFFVGV